LSYRKTARVVTPLILMSVLVFAWFVGVVCKQGEEDLMLTISIAE
jgi:hypothetical protein